MSLLSVSTLVTSATSASAEGGAVNVDLDGSLVLQIAVFVVLLLVLKPLLFDPMLKLFEEREKRIEGTRHAASKEDQRSAQALAKYEGILTKAREAGNAERDELRSAGQKREAEIMTRVRAQTAQTVEQGRSAIANESKEARAKLGAEAAGLARTIASRVLGREVQA